MRPAGGQNLVPVKARQHGQRRTGQQAARYHRQAADVVERQARQPAMLGRGDPETVRGGLSRGPDGLMSEDDAFRHAGGPAGRHDQGVTRLDRFAAGPAFLAIGPHHPAGAELVEHHLLSGARQPLVERQDGGAAVPRALQRFHERRPAGQVDCHQIRHDS
jgi:hypothetical protein